MTHHTITVSLHHMYYLMNGDKHFLVLRDTTPPLHYGDVLLLSHPSNAQPLVRWVRYAESGLGYAPNWVGVEVAP